MTTRVTVQTVAATSVYTMWFNSGRPALAKPEVRRALWQAVDFDTIIKSLYPQTGELSKSVVAPAVLGYSPADPPAYNPEAAKAALQAAGFDFSTKLQLQFSGAEYRQFIQAVAADLNKIGVQAEPTEKESAVFLEDLLAMRWDINFQSLSTPTFDAATNLGRLYTCAAKRNGYCNPALDTILSEAGSISDVTKRKELYAQASQIIWTDAVGMYPMSLKIAYAWRSEVQGLEPNPSFLPGLRDGDPVVTTPLTDPPLLRVEHLGVRLAGPPSTTPVLDDVSFVVRSGRTTGIIGESGSGKSMLATAIIGLLPDGSTTTGRLLLRDENLLGVDESRRRQVRGAEISMIFQDPLSALNPSQRIGRQVGEILRRNGTGRADADRAVVDLLTQVGIPDPAVRARNYPHQFSGGMRQRAMIALAVAGDPALVLADEPTTALDVTVQARILRLLRALQDERRMSMLLVSHDLRVMSHASHDLVVLYAGRVCERGPTRQVLRAPRHPYTRALAASVPAVRTRSALVDPLPGAPASPLARPPGCPFHPRCALARPRCASDVPVLREIAPDAVDRLPLRRGVSRVTAPPNLLEVSDLRVTFGRSRRPWRPNGGRVEAVAGVSLEVGQRETLALVGESGSGKTTVARCVVGLARPSAGAITFDGTPLADRRPSEQRRSIQMVFQDPRASLNPRMSVRRIVGEGWAVHPAVAPAGDRTDAVLALLDQVGLDRTCLDRRPAELSGGQCQRVSLARALALRPRLLVCDEAVSALDVSVQAQVLRLLADLRDRHALSILFITHDLGVVRQIADRVAVMRRGEVVETADVEQVFDDPRHPYTQELLDAALDIEVADGLEADQ